MIDVDREELKVIKDCLYDTSISSPTKKDECAECKGTGKIDYEIDDIQGVKEIDCLYCKPLVSLLEKIDELEDNCVYKEGTYKDMRLKHTAYKVALDDVKFIVVNCLKDFRAELIDERREADEQHNECCRKLIDYLIIEFNKRFFGDA